MKELLYSRKGATSVFLTAILASVLLLVGLFIQAASREAGRSCADAVLETAGRSVLSEYNLLLQKRYGIFAFHADESQVEKKIRYYADYSFHDNPLKEITRGSYVDLLELDAESVRVSLRGYSLTDAGLFERQILAYMKTGILKKNPFEKAECNPENEEIVLRNRKVINSLPSAGYESNIFIDIKKNVEEGIPKPEEIMKKGGAIYLVDEYILRHFRNHLLGNGDHTRDTFFRNEVEYILKGNLSDDKNYRAVRSDLFLMRNLLNLIHINCDPEKRKKVEAVAAALTLGEGEPVAAVVVAEAWAAAETENDLRLLENGKPVALVKRKENWAVPISDTLEYLWKDGFLEPKEMSGCDYENYLRILLYLENHEKKLFRCMDLIQINMKGCYDRDFDLKEHYGGFQLRAVVNGMEFTYEQKY
mgnify:CR=1 FL=1